MTTEELILSRYNGAPLLSLEQLAELLHRSKQGLRISLCSNNDLSRKILPCRVKIGRRVYFKGSV
ncbi:DNA-binding protein [Pseudomonas stutzeri]|uniref:DNA-binding protein n=1 Tax=Stutzerimonas stutzeri TaxID=316 RepID=UPI001E5F83E7|nr:DNA-binding protein [Stutzerimonas stutzeri]MCC8342443.1 DNA-binding protein [Stutzerimonas stutzeri]